MAFVEVKTLVGDLAVASFEFGYSTTGTNFYFVSTTGGNKIYEYNPVTNTETMIVQQSNLAAIKTNSSEPCMFFSGFDGLTPIGFQGFVYFLSYDTVTRDGYIWRWQSGIVALEFTVTIPPAELSWALAAPLLWTLTDWGIIFNWVFSSSGPNNGQYKTYFKPSADVSFRESLQIPELSTLADLNGQSVNTDTRRPALFYTTMNDGGGSQLIRWSGSDWNIIDSSYSGPLGFLYGPTYWWSAYPAPGLIPGKGTWTTDFSTFTDVVGSTTVFGGRMLNMPWEVGVSGLTDYYRYNSSINEWVAWCTGPPHQPGVSDIPFVMWETDTGDMYLFYAPFPNDWRVAKLTAGTCLNPSKLNRWGDKNPFDDDGLYTAQADFSDINGGTYQLVRVRHITQFGSLQYQKNFQVGSTDENVYIGNYIGANDNMVGRLAPPYVGDDNELTVDEDLTDSLSTDAVTGVDHTNAI